MTDLSDEYLLALGTIAVHSARLESELTHVLMRALGTRNPGVWSMLAAESFNAKIEKLKLLASREVEVNGERSRGPLNDIVSDEFAAMLDGLARRLDRARVVRNRNDSLDLAHRARRSCDPHAGPATWDEQD